MASVDLGALKIAITADNKDANKALEDTKKKVNNTSSSISKFGSAAKSGMKVAATAIAAVGAAAATAVGKIISMANETAAAADVIDKASQRMGLTTTQYQKLAYAAELSGVSMGTMEKAAKHLQESGSGLNLEQAIEQIAAIQDPAERSAKATELLGAKAAYEMAPLLNVGTEGIHDMYNEAD